jgi:polyisoprenoid-binding protein YceI
MHRMTIRLMLAFLSLAWLSAASADEPSSGSYAVDDELSWLRVRVYRAGLMSGLGHNHIVSTASISGSVEFAEPVEASSVELAFAVASLVVDDPQLRADAGNEFPGAIPDKDIRATRRNMLGRKLLDAERFSDIRIVSTSISVDGTTLQVEAEIFIKDIAYPVSIPARLTMSRGTIEASGEVMLSHRQLGLQPFSAALGTLRVASDMPVQFRIVATAAD